MVYLLARGERRGESSRPGRRQLYSWPVAAIRHWYGPRRSRGGRLPSARQQFLERHRPVRERCLVRHRPGLEQLAALDIVFDRVDAVERDHPALLQIDDREAPRRRVAADDEIVIPLAQANRL